MSGAVTMPGDGPSGAIAQKVAVVGKAKATHTKIYNKAAVIFINLMTRVWRPGRDVVDKFEQVDESKAKNVRLCAKWRMRRLTCGIDILVLLIVNLLTCNASFTKYSCTGRVNNAHFAEWVEGYSMCQLQQSNKHENRSRRIIDYHVQVYRE